MIAFYICGASQKHCARPFHRYGFIPLLNKD